MSRGESRERLKSLGTIRAVFPFKIFKYITMLMRISLFLALCGALAVAAVAYWFFGRSGPLNSSGGQPPTTCTVETVKQDCRKLNCVSNVWYCDKHGGPICDQNKCVCFYGCL
jgi:hypothetical protein